MAPAAPGCHDARRISLLTIVNGGISSTGLSNPTRVLTSLLSHVFVREPGGAKPAGETTALTERSPRPQTVARSTGSRSPLSSGGSLAERADMRMVIHGSFCASRDSDTSKEAGSCSRDTGRNDAVGAWSAYAKD